MHQTKHKVRSCASDWVKLHGINRDNRQIAFSEKVHQGQPMYLSQCIFLTLPEFWSPHCFLSTLTKLYIHYKDKNLHNLREVVVEVEWVWSMNEQNEKCQMKLKFY